MKKGQACRGKGIDALFYGCTPLLRRDRRTFWKQHRTAEKAEIRDQLAFNPQDDAEDEYDDDWGDRFDDDVLTQQLTRRDRAILATMGA